VAATWSPRVAVRSTWASLLAQVPPAQETRRASLSIRPPLAEQRSHDAGVARIGVKQPRAPAGRTPVDWLRTGSSYACSLPMQGGDVARGLPSPAFGDENGGADDRVVAEALADSVHPVTESNREDEPSLGPGHAWWRRDWIHAIAIARLGSARAPDPAVVLTHHDRREPSGVQPVCPRSRAFRDCGRWREDDLAATKAGLAQCRDHSRSSRALLDARHRQTDDAQRRLSRAA
jgi:hypothetical protein